MSAWSLLKVAFGHLFFINSLVGRCVRVRVSGFGFRVSGFVVGCLSVIFLKVAFGHLFLITLWLGAVYEFGFRVSGLGFRV